MATYNAAITAFSTLRLDSQVMHSELFSNNVDLFANEGSEISKAKVAIPAAEAAANARIGSTVDRYKDEAARLRKEAEEMEQSLREEARAKGLSEEMINQLIPVRTPKPAKAADPVIVAKPKLTSKEIRSKLGYLAIGDAVRMTADLDRYKAKDLLSLWNTHTLPDTFAASNGFLKAKTSIDPIKLKLDDVGYNYQNVFVAALVLGTALGLGSSTIGGQLGFLLGYASALLPIVLVGIGSIAPALIGDLLLCFQMLTNEEAKERYIHWNAARFVVGYVLGLPVNRFNVGGFSNTVEFFQLRPQSSSDVTRGQWQMFARNKFKQKDIARASVVCLAGAVAECIDFGSASGSNAADVNLLYEIMNAVEPPLPSESIQDQIRWAAVTSHEILSTNKEAYIRVIEAFRKGLPLEECIAALEQTHFDE